MNQLDPLALREAPGLRREIADAHDLHGLRTVVGDALVHLAHDAHIHALFTPLLALHQRDFALLAQHQVDAASGTAKPGFRDGVALTPEGLTDQQLGLTPVYASQTVQAAARVQQGSALASLDEGD